MLSLSKSLKNSVSHQMYLIIPLRMTSLMDDPYDKKYYLNDSRPISILFFVVCQWASLARADESEFFAKDFLTVFRAAESGSSQRRHVRNRDLVATPVDIVTILFTHVNSKNLGRSTKHKWKIFLLKRALF